MPAINSTRNIEISLNLLNLLYLLNELNSSEEATITGELCQWLDSATVLTRDSCVCLIPLTPIRLE